MIRLYAICHHSQTRKHTEVRYFRGEPVELADYLAGSGKLTHYQPKPKTKPSVFRGSAQPPGSKSVHAAAVKWAESASPGDGLELYDAAVLVLDDCLPESPVVSQIQEERRLDLRRRQSPVETAGLEEEDNEEEAEDADEEDDEDDFFPEDPKNGGGR
jgi:hypothetical protein